MFIAGSTYIFKFFFIFLKKFFLTFKKNSAGIGRTGTFATIHSILEQVKYLLATQPDEEPYVDVLNTILKMRQQRPGLIQTKVLKKKEIHFVVIIH